MAMTLKNMEGVVKYFTCKHKKSSFKNELFFESNIFYLPSAASFASFFNFQFSQITPPIQYGTTNVRRNINSQKPAVKMNMNNTNPENSEKSNIINFFNDTKIKYILNKKLVKSKFFNGLKP